MRNIGQDTLKTRRTLDVNGKTYHYFSLSAASDAGVGDWAHLPYSLKVLAENLLRFEDGESVTVKDIQALANWQPQTASDHEIAYRPARVLMQDFTGVPGVVDLAAMRNAMVELGGDPSQISPLSPVDLVIDHSVQVDRFASKEACQLNTEIEMKRNQERYEFLRWGQQSFNNFRVVPPGTGICHQVNLEYLGQTVWSQQIGNDLYAYPDTLVGTDSHTTMINGLGILGWGVGGIEAEAAMLGQPISMLIPDVVGFRLCGKLNEGITATDLVLTVTKMLREHGVVGKFVEFFGPGLSQLPLADRATIANMAPEYGATCGFFPVDQVTLDYLELTGRSAQTVALVEHYCKAQGLWCGDDAVEPHFSSTLELDLSSVVPSLAGPKRPQDKVTVPDLPSAFTDFLNQSGKSDQVNHSFPVENAPYELKHGDVVIAAITSCTNTSNPSVLMAAGLLAKKAIAKGLARKPWVKTSLAPGSKVVTDYLNKAGLQQFLDQLGFNLVGYGCTTCIGNSGPLPEAIANTIASHDLVVSSVLSGNRNFEGRVHPQVKANWLTSPPLVVAYALAGTTRLDLSTDPIGYDKAKQPIYLKDIWPSQAEINAAVALVDQAMFRKEYADVFGGDARWQELSCHEGLTYDWQQDSTYVRQPPFFQHLKAQPDPIQDIRQARVLAVLGDSITTDHISPAGVIKADSPAGRYLAEQGIASYDFNSYGARRGNHEVMMRGTFANIRIRNEMVANIEGGYTRYIPNGEVMSIYDAAMRYQADKIPLVVIAGKEYGTGSSRDWAAKGTLLLGVRAVIAESFERIHRSNLIGMGVLPLQFMTGESRRTLGLTGTETIDILDLTQLTPGDEVMISITSEDGQQRTLKVKCRIDTHNELNYYYNGGILPYVLRSLL